MSDDHRNLFSLILQEAISQFHVEIHAFCLMNNHYHLLIKTPLGNLSRTMRYIDGVYTQRYNRQTDRDGPLFRGRYKAILIDTDSYLLQVSRYIHLNPVTAKICNSAFEFKWSSYHSFVNSNLLTPWLTTSQILSYMPGDNKHTSYAKFISEGIDEKTNQFYKKKQIPSILGRNEFVENHLSKLNRSYTLSTSTDINRTKILPSAELILHIILDLYQITAENLKKSIQGKRNDARMIAIYLLRRLAHMSHRSIAEMLGGIKATSISPAIMKIEKLINNDGNFNKQLNDVIMTINKLLGAST